MSNTQKGENGFIQRCTFELLSEVRFSHASFLRHKKVQLLVSLHSFMKERKKVIDMRIMSVRAHGRVGTLLNTELVAEYYAHSQSCENRPIATSTSVHMQIRPSI